MLAALQPWRGPERLIDLQLRVGPYGDQFGRKPDRHGWLDKLDVNAA